MSRAIASLAVIKVNWDTRRKDFIENFVPFVVTLISRGGYDEISINGLCKDFEAEFGLRVPYHPMLAILNRVRKHGYIRRRKSDGSYIPTRDKVVADDFTDIALEQERKYQKVIGEFVQFAKDDFGEVISESEANAIFISYLQDHDLDVLFANQDLSTILPEASSSTAQKFLFNSFVKLAYENDPAIFSFIVDISVGHIMANTLLYRNYARFKDKLSGGSLYLDIGLLFSALGVDGPDMQEVYTECLHIFSEHKFHLFVFRHTCDEFMGILDSCLQWIESKHFDPLRASRALMYFKDNGFTSSDVEQFITDIDKKLENLGVEVVEKSPVSSGQAFQIDETRLQELIVQVYRDKDPHFDEVEKDYTLYQDVKSIAAIHRLREGIRPRKMSQAKHTFVTTNSSLAYASRLYEMEEEYPYFSLPAALTDVFVSTLIWIQSPSKVSISEKRLIANCYASLQPNKLLLRKLVETADRLRAQGDISEDEVTVLKASRVARNLLQKQTLADPERFTHRTVIDILNEIRLMVRREERAKYDKEKESFLARIQEVQASKGHVQKQLEIAMSQAQELSGIKDRLDNNARKDVKIILWIFPSVCVLLWIALGVLILRVGWDKIEPWTYLIGFGWPLASYLFFVATQRSFSPAAIYEQLVAWRKEKVYQEAGFDVEKYEQARKRLEDLRDHNP